MRANADSDRLLGPQTLTHPPAAAHYTRMDITRLAGPDRFVEFGGILFPRSVFRIERKRQSITARHVIVTAPLFPQLSRGAK